MPADSVGQMLNRLLGPVSRSLSPVAARKLIELRADPVAQQRIDELADRCNEGSLTTDEQSEYEAYISAATLIGILQAKARAALDAGAAP